MYVSIYTSIYPSIHPYVYLYIYLSSVVPRKQLWEAKVEPHSAERLQYVARFHPEGGGEGGGGVFF